MDKELIEKYKKELLEIYKKSKHSQKAVSTAATADNGRGGLQVSATTARGIYPVKGAQVTVFEGPYENMRILDRSYTDESGKTAVFYLPAPAKAMSESVGATELPYAQYNISVLADGFVEHINMNVPIFDGVTSLQSADLILISAAGTDTSPRVFYENRDYNL